MATSPRDENPSKNKQTLLHAATPRSLRGAASTARNNSQCLMLLWAVKSGDLNPSTGCGLSSCLQYARRYRILPMGWIHCLYMRASKEPARDSCCICLVGFMRGVIVLVLLRIWLYSNGRSCDSLQSIVDNRIDILQSYRESYNRQSTIDVPYYCTLR